MPCLPTSGQILRELADAFELRRLDWVRCDLCKRTTRRYFEGKRVKRPCCVQSAIVAPLMLLASDALNPRLPTRWTRIAGFVIAQHFTAWDLNVVPRANADDVLPLLRFAAVDFATRAAIVLSRLGLPDLEERLPAWAAMGERDACLDELRDKCTTRPTYDELASRLEVHRNTIVKWFTGKSEPDLAHQELLAEEFVSRIPDSELRVVGLTLMRHFGLKRLARRLRRAIGPGPFAETLLFAIRLANHRAAAHRRGVSPAERLDDASFLLVIATPWLAPQATINARCCQVEHLGADGIAGIDRAQRLFFGSDGEPSFEMFYSAVLEHYRQLPRHDARPDRASSQG